MCACVCAHVFVCVHVCTCVYVCACTFVCAHVGVCVHVRVCTLHSLEIFQTTDSQTREDHYKLTKPLKPPVTYNAILDNPEILE